MRRRLFVLALSGLLSNPAAFAQDSAIRVDEPWVRRAPVMPDARAGETSATAGYATLLKPGAYHLMLIGLKRPLTPGQMVVLVFEFERAGRMTARAPVR